MQNSILVQDFQNPTTTLEIVTGWDRPIIFLPFRVYRVTAMISWTGGSNFGGGGFDFAGNPMSIFGMQGLATGDSAGVFTRLVNSLNANCLEVADGGSAYIDTIIHARQGGELQPRFAQNVPDPVASTLFAYSVIQAQDITP